MEEFTHTLLENGSIERKNNQFVLSRRVDDIQMPDTIQGIIAARMDRLEENLKRTMQVASVVGRDFAFRILQTITGMREELKAYLLNLQALEFIYEKSLFPELEYIFKHALTQEVAYNSLLQKRRKEIHEKIGRAIEELYPERLEEFYEMLAYHYSKSENLAKAYRYAKLSGEKASKNHSLWEALEFYKKVIDILDRFSEGQENKRRKLKILNTMAVLFRVFGGYPENSIQYLQLGEKLALELGDEASLSSIYSLMGHYQTLKGNLDIALKYQENCYQKAVALDDIELLAPTVYDLFTSYAFVGQYRKITEITPKVIDMLEKMGREADFFGRPDNVYSEMCAHYGLGLGMIGKFKMGEVFFEKSLKFAVDLGDLRTLGCNEWLYGMFYHIKGAWKLAVERLESSIRYSQETKWLFVLAMAYSTLGCSYAQLGKPELALSNIEKGFKIKKESGIEVITSLQNWMTCETYFNRGDPKIALEFAEMALTSSQQTGEKLFEGISWMLLGKLLGHNDPSNIDKAEENIQKGIRILEALETKPFSARGYLYMGELYSSVRGRKKATQNLKKAAALFQEMRMDFWLEKTKEVIEKL